MATTTLPASSRRPPARGISALVAAAARLAQRRPRTVLAAWLIFVIACVALGAASGSRTLTDTQSEVGQSRTADDLIARAGLRAPATENVLVTSGAATSTAATVADLTARVGKLPEAATVTGPAQSPELSVDGGRIALVQVALAGDPTQASDHVQPLLDTVAAVGTAHPGSTLQEVGPGTQDKAINDLIDSKLQHAELISLPITLLILLVAFGALVAASVPLILGLTSVAAAMGALGLVSRLAPNSDSTSAVVILIGLAVGVDYSLFYIRREREERLRGHGPARVAKRAQPDSALEAAASSVGRAILVSGVTVMVALAGLLITGQGDFLSMGLGTILVVAVAVLGSLTVLPAVLALLGDRVDRGRLPGHRGRAARAARRRAASGGRPTGAWAALARAVTASPKAALVAAVCVLGALAVPLTGMHTADLGADDLPQSLPVVQAAKAVDHSFPGAPDQAELVVSGHDLGTAAAHSALAGLGERALKVTGGRGEPTVTVARDGATAVVAVPMPDRGVTAGTDTVHRLRDQVAPTATTVPGASSPALVTGDAASSADYSHRMAIATPLVIGFVLVLGFLLLLLTFRAPLLAAGVMGLNLLSIGASYGILVSVFQHTWAERLIGFHSSGHIINWLPLFMFVILFGLSMDYTVLVLERIREGREAGLSPRRAAADGVAATAGTVTSAAIVMVAVFAIFATLGVINFQELGVGLAVAVLLDATVVRGIALPALVAALGERGWKVRPHVASSRAPGWEDVAVAGSEAGR
jgi:uncharacterized membrane protein YdfJ with MMPL/SSD domain